VAVALAVDIGGTKLAAGRVDEDGRLTGATTVHTPQSPDAEALWAALADLVAGVAQGDEVVCGVGAGGPMTAGGEEVSPLNIPAWRGFPLRRRLADHTGLAVAVDNDAKALARGEGWVGAGRDVRDFIAMVVSTGVGGGLVVDGRLLHGAAGNAGHIGHVIVEPEGRPCGCGARGCLEAEASGTGIRAATGRSPAEAPPELVRHVGACVGRAVASVANLCDLRLALVAGSVALGYGDAFFEAARAEAATRARLPFTCDLRIVPPLRPAEAPLLGAAAVAWWAQGLRW
jgi:glucokinase